jgi:tripartite-type tricarboxylate transporter receptor subunit TctC
MRFRLTLCATLLLAAPALAQQYPVRPIKMILPVPPAAGVDVIVRKAGDALQSRLGQGLVVDNRASANMVTGADACAKAQPDGYNLCSLSALSVALNPLTISKLPYDAEKDFRPIFNMFVLRGGLIAKASLPVSSTKELQALAVAKPGVLNMGTLGPNSTVDISRQWLEQHWNTKITGIPYKGAPLIIQALVAGEIDFAWIGAYNAIGPIKGGKVKLITIDGARRTPLFPEVPVVGELGLSGLPAGRPFWGIFGPARVPDNVVRRVNEEFGRLFKEPSFVEFLDGQMVDIVGGTPEEFARFIAEERVSARQMVQKYNIPKE